MTNKKILPRQVSTLATTLLRLQRISRHFLHSCFFSLVICCKNACVLFLGLVGWLCCHLIFLPSIMVRLNFQGRGSKAIHRCWKHHHGIIGAVLLPLALIPTGSKWIKQATEVLVLTTSQWDCKCHRCHWCQRLVPGFYRCHRCQRCQSCCRCRSCQGDLMTEN